jgi:CRP-like cAMP-binding protein
MVGQTDLLAQEELRAVPALAEVPREVLAELALTAVQHRVHAGVTLVEQGAQATHLEVLARGAIKVVRTTKHALGESQVVLEVASGPVDERVRHLLEGLANDHGTPFGQGKFIAIPLRRRDIACMVNATTETVSRVLARFEREGLTRSTRDGIWLKVQSASMRPPPPGDEPGEVHAGTSRSAR